MLNFHCFSGWPFVHPVKNELTTQENNQVGIDKTLWIASIHVKFINTSENDRTSFHGGEVEIVIFSPLYANPNVEKKNLRKMFSLFHFRVAVVVVVFMAPRENLFLFTSHSSLILGDSPAGTTHVLRAGSNSKTTQ